MEKKIVTYANSCANGFVSFPQHLVETLGQLQAHTTNVVSSSIYIYDLVEQHTLCTSYSVAAMLGYTADAIQAMEPIGLASLIHPDDLEQVSEHYQRFTTLSYGEIITLEYRMKRADGTWARLRSQETPLVEATDGFPLQLLGMVQDITHLSAAHSRKSTVLRRSLKQRRAVQRLLASSIKQKSTTSVQKRPA